MEEKKEVERYRPSVRPTVWQNGPWIQMPSTHTHPIMLYHIILRSESKQFEEKLKEDLRKIIQKNLWIEKKLSASWMKEWR